jgi:TonB family protein
VQLSIVVNTNGKATDIKVTKSLGMGLDEKAVEAIQKWVFKPGTNKGVPVNVRALVEVNFRLL